MGAGFWVESGSSPSQAQFGVQDRCLLVMSTSSNSLVVVEQPTECNCNITDCEKTRCENCKDKHTTVLSNYIVHILVSVHKTINDFANSSLNYQLQLLVVNFGDPLKKNEKQHE